MNADHLEILLALGTEPVHCFGRDRHDVTRVSMQLFVSCFDEHLTVEHDPGFCIRMPVKLGARRPGRIDPKE